MRDADDAGRPVVGLQLAHGCGQLLEQVVRDRQVIDPQVQLAHRVVKVGVAVFGRNNVFEGEFHAGTAGPRGAVGEGDGAVDDVDGGVEVFQRQRQAGVAEGAVGKAAGYVVAERLAGGGVVSEGGPDRAVAAKLPHLGGGVSVDGGQALHEVGADRHGRQFEGGGQVSGVAPGHGAEANRAGHVGAASPRDGDDAGRVLDCRQGHVLDFQQGRVGAAVWSSSRTVPCSTTTVGSGSLGSQGASRPSRLHRPSRWRTTPQLRSVEFQLADGEGAGRKPLLVVVDDGGRDIEDIFTIQTVGAR